MSATSLRPTLCLRKAHTLVPDPLNLIDSLPPPSPSRRRFVSARRPRPRVARQRGRASCQHRPTPHKMKVMQRALQSRLPSEKWAQVRHLRSPLYTDRYPGHRSDLASVLRRQGHPCSFFRTYDGHGRGARVLRVDDLLHPIHVPTNESPLTSPRRRGCRRAQDGLAWHAHMGLSPPSDTQVTVHTTCQTTSPNVGTNAYPPPMQNIDIGLRTRNARADERGAMA